MVVQAKVTHPSLSAGPCGQLGIQLVRYATVGLSNVALDVLLLNAAIRLSRVTHGRLLILFASLSFLAAVLNSYYWNGRWTFQARLRWKAQLPTFAGINIIGLAINDAVIYLLTALPHPWFGDSAVLHVNEAKAAAIAVTATWNFLAYRCFIFRTA